MSHNRQPLSLVAVLVCILAASEAHAVRLVAHWRLNESTAPYADSGLLGVPLQLDSGTAAATSSQGIEGAAPLLHFENPPGVSSRLYTSDAAVQSDSFGFSFWIRPVQLNPGDNLIAKEMSFDNSVPAYSRVSWKVNVLSDDGSGRAALEFIVRGDDRSRGDFFGSAISAAVVPLYQNASNWIHVAGGYSSASGLLVLYVNGAKTLSGNSAAGARQSDGGAFSMGSARNGSDFVAFAGTALFEDMQLYDAVLSDEQVDFLHSNPGETVTEDFEFASASFDRSAGSIKSRFETVNGDAYFVQASTNHSSYVTVSTVQPNLALLLDPGTGAPQYGSGIEGNAPKLIWDVNSTATRLYSADSSLQSDSFGFSFWLKPVYLNPFDNLLAKEMPFNSSIPLYSRMSWQLHVYENDGNNAAQLQLIVRGNNRSIGDFYGTARSSRTVPLYAMSTRWIHVAGGYDSGTGQLRIFVDGQETDSINSSPGALSSDGSAFAVGSARNGDDFVAFAGVAYLDDLRLYSSVPTLPQVTAIVSNPGQDTPEPRLARWLLNAPASPYLDEGGAPALSTISLQPSTLESLLGAGGTRSAVSLRVLRQARPTSGFELCE